MVTAWSRQLLSTKGQSCSFACFIAVSLDKLSNKRFVRVACETRHGHMICHEQISNGVSTVVFHLWRHMSSLAFQITGGNSTVFYQFALANNKAYIKAPNMMTSSDGNIFRVTGHLCGEFTGLRWIPHTKASDAELWYFLWCAPNSTSE